MAFRFFKIPCRGCTETEAELNLLLRSFKIFSVDRRWIDLGLESCWAICVDYLERSMAPVVKLSSDADVRSKVDYKTILNDADFRVFSRLRDLRKEIAQAEAVPVYTIFTNEQLAKIVQNRADSKSELEKINGVGGARLSKYGDRIIEFLIPFWKEQPLAAPSEKSV